MRAIIDTSITWALPARDRSVPKLRTRFQGWLVEQGLDRNDIEDWMLVASELMANACQAAPSDGTITLEASRQPGRIELRISNPIDAPIGPIGPIDPGPLATSGRGLHIVRRLTDGMDIDVGADRVRVSCWIDDLS